MSPEDRTATSIVDFLNARYDEAVSAADDWPWDACAVVGDDRNADDPPPCDCAHPRRVLADIDSNRRILAICVEDLRQRGNGALVGEVDRPTWDILCALALPHAEHPDYRPEWRP